MTSCLFAAYETPSRKGPTRKDNNLFSENKFFPLECTSFQTKNKSYPCLSSQKRDIGKQCRPRTDTTERGVCSESTIFALSAGISVKHGDNKKYPDTPSTGNGPVQKLR